MKHIFLFLCLGSFFSVFGQNLVPNGGFESYSVIPDGYCQWNKCIGWSNVNGTIGCTSSGSPDYFHTNAVSSVTLPNTSSGTNILPNSGDATMGFLTWSGSIYTNFREYLSIQLIQPLIPGQSYQVSFYLSNGNTPYYGYGSDNIGMHFSNGPLVQGTNEVINVTPQIEITSVFFSNTWQLFTFTFVPTSNFNTITFGNFRDDSNTSAQQYYSSNGRAYYFIDDISIVTANNSLNINGTAEICLGDTSVLFGTGDSGNSYNWATSTNPGTIFSTDSTVSVSPLNSTTYLLYGTDDTVSFTVNVSSPPQVNLGNDTTLCPGEIVLLNATIPGASYVWQDNSSGPTYTVSQQGIYWVEVTVNNCTSTDTINVIYNSGTQIDLGNDTTLCDGTSLLLNATFPGASYTWQDNSTDPTYNVTQEGSYWVEVLTNACSTIDTINVNYSPIPLIFLGNDTSMCQIVPWQLDVTTSNASYLWQNGSTGPTFTIEQAGLFWVELSIDGCTNTANLVVELTDCDVLFEMPNVFTPNKDGSNDIFHPVKNIGITSFTILICNRWGQTVFESEDLNVNWDGTFKGDDCTEGTYFWLVKYVTVNEDSISESGFVQLER